MESTDNEDRRKRGSTLPPSPGRTGRPSSAGQWRRTSGNVLHGKDVMSRFFRLLDDRGTRNRRDGAGKGGTSSTTMELPSEKNMGIAERSIGQNEREAEGRDEGGDGGRRALGGQFGRREGGEIVEDMSGSEQENGESVITTSAGDAYVGTVVERKTGNRKDVMKERQDLEVERRLWLSWKKREESLRRLEMEDKGKTEDEVRERQEEMIKKLLNEEEGLSHSLKQKEEVIDSVRSELRKKDELVEEMKKKAGKVEELKEREERFVKKLKEKDETVNELRKKVAELAEKEKEMQVRMERERKRIVRQVQSENENELIKALFKKVETIESLEKENEKLVRIVNEKVEAFERERKRRQQSDELINSMKGKAEMCEIFQQERDNSMREVREKEEEIGTLKQKTNEMIVRIAEQEKQIIFKGKEVRELTESLREREKVNSTLKGVAEEANIMMAKAEAERGAAEKKAEESLAEKRRMEAMIATMKRDLKSVGQIADKWKESDGEGGNRGGERKRRDVTSSVSAL